MALVPFPTEFPMNEVWKIALDVWTGGGVADKRQAALVVCNAVFFAVGQFVTEKKPLLTGAAKPKKAETHKAYLLRLAKAYTKPGAKAAAVYSFDWMKIVMALLQLLAMLKSK